jgi:hypothetical protein
MMDNRLRAFVWMDRQRRYFISTASSLDAGTPYTRLQWRQVDESPNAEPTRVELTVPQPTAAQIYYDACAMVDRHNRHCQDTLGLEEKLGTHNWGLRINLRYDWSEHLACLQPASAREQTRTKKTSTLCSVRSSLITRMIMCTIDAAEMQMSRLCMPAVQNFLIEQQGTQGQVHRHTLHLQKGRWLHAMARKLHIHSRGVGS